MMHGLSIRSLVLLTAAGSAAPPATFQSASTTADGYGIDLSYDGTPPADANFALSGCPEYVVGSVIAGNVRTLLTSGPVLNNETVTVSSDLLIAESVTNISTEAGGDYTTGMLVRLHAGTGVTTSGGLVTTIADQSGNGCNFTELYAGNGSVFEASHAAFGGLPLIRQQSNRALGCSHATLINHLLGQGKPWTVVMLWTGLGGVTNSYLWCYGDKDRPSGNRFIVASSDPESTGDLAVTWTMGAGIISATNLQNNVDRFQRFLNFPRFTAWTYDGSTVSIYNGRGDSLALASNAAVMVGPITAAELDTFAIGARLNAVSAQYGTAWGFNEFRMYNAALTPAQLRQVGRAIGTAASIPVCMGMSFPRAA